MALTRRVLLVDGDPERVGNLLAVLEGRYPAQAVGSVPAAFVAAYDGQWSAAVVAHELPHGSGLEVLHHLRTSAPRAFRIAHMARPDPAVRYDFERFGDPHATLCDEDGHLAQDVLRTLDEFFAPAAVDEQDRHEPLTPLGAWTAQARASRVFLTRLREAAESDAPVYLYGEIASGTERAAVMLREWRRAWRAHHPQRRREDPVIVLRVPSLRERLQDIPTIAQRCLAEHARATGEPEKTMEPAVVEELLRRQWFGNVIELRSVLVHASHTAGRKPVIALADLPPANEHAWPLTRLARYEGQRDCVLRQLSARRHVSRAAESDGSARANYIRLMRRLGIVRADVVTRVPGERG